MGVSARSLGGALAETVGTGRVREADGLTVDGCPVRWVVAPATVEQVAAVLALARDAGLAVVPRGSGSALDLGRPPRRVDVLLDLCGLDRILEDHPEDLTVSVEAGVTAGALAARLGARRQWFPVDPPGWAARTLGGITATAASGPLRARYGAVRDLLLGVRFVQADGVVTWGGARVVKSVTGYDVPKLLTGSLGTLGVLVELTLRLHPMPEHEETWVAALAGPEAAQDFVARLVDSTVQPNRVEYLDAAAQRACGLEASPAAIAVAVGSVEAAVREQGASIAGLARAAGGTVAPAPAEFWNRYDQALGRPPGDVALQVASLASRLGATAAAVERGLARLSPTARAVVSGCAVLGTFRVRVTGGETGPLAALVEDLRAFVGPVGGCAIVHGGPPELRERIDPWGPVEPGALDLMRGIKDTFDPTRVLNPGRFVGGL